MVRFLCFLEHNFEVCKSSNWVVRVLVIVIKPPQNRIEDGMFEHPTRDAFALVSPKSLSMNNHTTDAWSLGMDLFTNILKYMRIAVEFARFIHWNIDKGSIQSWTACVKP